MRLRVAICFYDFSDNFTTFCGLTLAKGLYLNNVEVFCISRTPGNKKRRKISVNSFPDTSFTSWESTKIKNIDVYVMLFAEWEMFPHLKFVTNRFRVIYLFSATLSNKTWIHLHKKRIGESIVFSSNKRCVERLLHRIKMSTYIHYAPIGIDKTHLKVNRIKPQDKVMMIVRDTHRSKPVFEVYDHELAILSQVGFTITYKGAACRWFWKRWEYMRKKTYVSGTAITPNKDVFKKAMFYLITMPSQEDGLYTLNAMAYGCVVIVALDIEPEHCFFGYNCIQTKPNELSKTVYKLLNDKELYEQIVACGYQYVSQYADNKKHAKHFIETVCRYMR